MTIPGAGVLVAIALGVVLGATHPQDGADGAGPADPRAAGALPPPAAHFDTLEDRERFDRARQHFVEGSWKDALRGFRDCRKGADAEAQAAIATWERACDGAKHLAGIESEIAKSRWRRAWTRIDAVRGQFGETPLRVHLDPLIDAVRQKLFTPLADYEGTPLEHEISLLDDHSDHAEYSMDAARVRRGERSLRWSPVEQSEVIAGVVLASFEPALLEGHKTFDVALYNAAETPVRLLLIFHLGVMEKIASNTGSVSQVSCLYHRIQLEKPGWNEVTVDLARDLKPNGKATLAQAKGIFLVDVRPPSTKTVFIDDVRLGRE